MGCVSSKLFKRELRRDIIHNNGGGECIVNHVVSLTSTTYGALKLDQTQQQQQPPAVEILVAETDGEEKQRSPPPQQDEPEVINTWELMEDLEEGVPVSNQTKNSPKPRPLLRGFTDSGTRTPFKFLNQIGSPRKAKTFGGKENKVKRGSDFSPRPVFRSKNSPENSRRAVLRLSYPVKGPKTESSSGDSGVSLRERGSFSPLFDPELVALYERELSEEEEQIKRIISATPRTQNHKNSRNLESLLQFFERKVPPGGENAVVVYTTSLRGIRKTFEDCNNVRSIIESYHIHTLERDVSMDLGFKEELRKLMGTKEVKVPLVFVKGRLIGGADQVLKLEEEGKLGDLFNGIPGRLAGGCQGCAGVRFVMCMKCSGSCKVLDEEQKKMMRCIECNENGLIRCRICC